MKTLTKLGVALGSIVLLGAPHVVSADTVKVNYIAEDPHYDKRNGPGGWEFIAKQIFIENLPEGESYKVEILEIPGYSFDKVLAHTHKRPMVPWAPTGDLLTFPYMIESSSNAGYLDEVNVIYKKIETPETPPAPNDGDSNSDNTQTPPKAKNGGKGRTGFEFENNSDQSESTLQLEARKAEIRTIIENYRALVGQVKALNPADYTPESWNKVYEEDTPFIYINAKSVAKAYEDDLSFITVDPNSLNKYTTLEDLERTYMWGYSFVKNAIPVLQQAIAGLVRVGETPNPQPNPNPQPPAVDKPLILHIVAVEDEGTGILDEYTITLNPGESKTVTAKEIPGYEVVGPKTRVLDYEKIKNMDVGNYVGFIYRKIEEPQPSPSPDGNGDNNGSKPDNGDSQNPDGKNPDGQKPDDNSNQNPDGKNPDDGNSDQKPEDPDNGKKPDDEKPGDGKKPDGNSNGKKPDGNNNGKDQTPPNNGGSNSGGSQTPPSKGKDGSGSNGNTQTPPSTKGNGSNANSQIPPKTNGGTDANGNAQSGNNAQNGNTTPSGTGGSVKTTPQSSTGTGKTEAKSAANTA
ncbi:MucBP domain-containing protein, partial [Streptococcus merionis]|uniref:MucBP domain-containing protein n=1 Tax=Streptococcus merionis TaxID=400065 RepID=UPI0026EE95D2